MKAVDTGFNRLGFLFMGAILFGKTFLYINHRTIGRTVVIRKILNELCAILIASMAMIGFLHAMGLDFK